MRSNGEPLYTLVNPVDDSLMEITHVLRGEDLLPSTPRQIVLYEALKQIGVGSGRTPSFGHLPTVLGEGNRRLSKRDKGSGLAEYQQEGYLPEALLNYLALLGWAIAEDRDIFAIDEMVEAFDIRRVNANPARFDAEEVRGHQRRAHPAAAARGARPTGWCPSWSAPDWSATRRCPDEQDRLAAATPLVQERINTLSEAVDLLAFLFLRRRQAHHRPGRRADRRLRADADRGRAKRWRDRDGVRSCRDRGGTAYGAGRGPGTEAAARLRSGPRRHHRAPDLAAAVRVDRAARPGVHAGPDRRGAGRPAGAR